MMSLQWISETEKFCDHVDRSVDAAISTVKVAANAAINRIIVKVNEKQSEISGFGLIK